MNALELLKKQHREADELFEKLEKASLEQKDELFDKLADALAVHTMIEEKHFYPASMVGSDTEELLRAAVEEHLGIKRFIADLLEIDAGDPTFDAKVNVLKEQVQHHVKEEEDELFPKVEKLLDESRLDELGVTMAAMTRSLQGMDPRNDIPRQTRAAASVESEDKGRRAA
ncbi:MAG: hemerythrin domain-containing protein [Minicystis sp.]